MPTIKVPRSFYVKERTQVYSNWQQGFWRELIQNSVDAGSKRLDITLEGRGQKMRMAIIDEPTRLMFGFPGHELREEMGSISTETTAPQCLISFQDDGPGMTRDVLERVYMTLGASEKGQGAAGGFGRARILTCFSHPAWMLKSQDWVCQSADEGTGYEVRASHDDHRGLLVQVSVEEPLHTMKHGLYYVLNQCEVAGLEVFVDGQQFTHLSVCAPVQRGERLKSLLNGDEAVLYRAVGGNCANRLLIRVNGLIMFEEYMFGAKDGAGYVLELDPATSRSHLNANRDSLKGPLAKILSKLISELNQGNTDAAHEQARPPSMTRYGVGQPLGHRNAAKASLPEYRQRRNKGKRYAPEVRVKDPRAMLAELFRRLTADRSELIEQALTEQDPLVLYLEGTPALVQVNANQEKWHRVADEWNLSTWKAVITDNGVVGWFPEYKQRAELLKAWALACEVGASFLTLLTGNNYVFYPGVTIDTTVHAICVTTESVAENGMRVRGLLFNPFYEDASGAVDKFFDIKTNDGLREFISVALHEVVHLEIETHSSRYANTLTDLYGLINIEELMTAIRNRL